VLRKTKPELIEAMKKMDRDARLDARGLMPATCFGERRVEAFDLMLQLRGVVVEIAESALGLGIVLRMGGEALRRPRLGIGGNLLLLCHAVLRQIGPHQVPNGVGEISPPGPIKDSYGSGGPFK
jgi:hypothetical protein